MKLAITPDSSISIYQVSGTTRSIGRASTTVTLLNITKRCIFHVVHDFKYPALLGLDICDSFGLHVDIPNRRIYTTPNANVHRTFTCNYLAPSENTILCEFLESNQDVFAQNETDVGRIKIARHTIACKEHPPIQLRPYRRSNTDYDEIRRQVQDLLAKGQVRESTSPWAFPVALVPKKDGGERMVIDYRRLNAITIDDKMPVPVISEVFDRLKGAKYFSKLDIAW